jgi:CRP-like cAMP-binding protein
MIPSIQRGKRSMSALGHQQMSTLGSTTIFRALPPETLQRLAEGTWESKFKRGGVIFGRGSVATGIHVVTTGQVKLSLDTAQGTEYVVEIMREGDSFGEAAVLTKRLHPVTAIAVTDSTILHVCRQALMAELTRDSCLANHLIGALSARLYQQTSDLEKVLFLKATGRVARYIVERCMADGKTGNRRLALPARKGLIASHLHMTQEHFSRTLRELTTGGLISVDGGIVDIIEVEKLYEVAGMMCEAGLANAAD